jgi:hypothetical protein
VQGIQLQAFEFSRCLGVKITVTRGKRQNSLFISLLAGNFEGRLVGVRLRPQPVDFPYDFSDFTLTIFSAVGGAVGSFPSFF